MSEIRPGDRVRWSSHTGTVQKIVRKHRTDFAVIFTGEPLTREIPVDQLTKIEAGS